MTNSMLLFWLFGSIAVISALFAALVSDYRYAVLAALACGFSAGGVHLALGSEFLAVTEFILSILFLMVLMLYVVLFGSKEMGSKFFLRSATLVVSLAFAAVIWFASRRVPVAVDTQYGDNEVAELGKTLFGSQLLPMEILALTLFLVIIGIGVISRADKRGDS